MNCFVVFFVRVSQNLYPAPEGDAGDDDPHRQIGPVGPEPSDEATRDHNAKVGRKVVPTERIRGPDMTSGSRNRANSQTQTALMAAALNGMPLP